MKDSRIVYGAFCTWWDSIDKVGRLPTPSGSIPCCPQCQSVLFEVNPDFWEHSVAAHAARPGNEEYPAFVEWLRGKCYPTQDEAKKAYKARSMN